MNKNIHVKISGAILASLFLLGSAGCSTVGGAPDIAETAELENPNQPIAEEEIVLEESTPDPQLIETYQVGDKIELPSANIIVRTLEETDELPSIRSEMTEDFVAPDGKRLWFFDIEWTNNTSEAVSKECHGPDMMNLRVYDIDGVEMLRVSQPGMIEGQECGTGLMKGETGTWMSGFTGPDSEFGWAVFEDYAGGEAVVTLDPDLELERY